MKILSRDENKDTMIVQISFNEVANLCGAYSSYSDEFKKLPKSGDIEVSALYKDKQTLIEIKDELKKVEEKLSEFAPFLKRMKQKKLRSETKDQ